LPARPATPRVTVCGSSGCSDTSPTATSTDRAPGEGSPRAGGWEAPWRSARHPALRHSAGRDRQRRDPPVCSCSSQRCRGTSIRQLRLTSRGGCTSLCGRTEAAAGRPAPRSRYRGEGGRRCGDRSDHRWRGCGRGDFRGGGKKWPFAH
jgi:hypothetical protein